MDVRCPKWNANLSQVEQLVEGCLHRIQHYELPDDAEPPTVHWPSND